MSKFRARALDSTRALPIYRSEDIPDLAEYVAINRSVSQMPTGMEKEEESERHLQEAIETRQYYGSHSASIIPIPDVTKNLPTHVKYYRQDIATPDGLIRMSGLGTEEEQPDYDMDSEDEEWLKAQSKDRPISPSQFETMMDKLEKGSGNTVLTEAEAQGLLKGNPDLVVAVYDYWLSKRLRLGHPLTPVIKTDRRDGSTGNNPYIAFRKRMEKMQTRKNRKNDEVAYMYMVKLQRELVRVCTLGKQMKEREERKHESTKLDLQIFQKRYALNDWSGTVYNQLIQEHGREPLTTKSYPTKQAQVVEDEWSPNKHKEWDGEMGQIGRHEVLYKKQKRRKKHKSLLSSSEKQLSEQKEPKTSQEEHDMLQEKSEDEAPDGVFTFQRRPYVKYLQHHNSPPNLHWRRLSTHEPLAKRLRFSETVFGGRFVGLARRRFGRGQRLILDCAPCISESETTKMETGMETGRLPDTSMAGLLVRETSVHSQQVNSKTSQDPIADATRRRRYCSRSPSPSLPHPSYLPPSLLHVRDTVTRPPRYKPPPSAFLTPLPSGPNSASLATFMGQPSSCFHLHEAGNWTSQKPQVQKVPTLPAKLTAASTTSTTSNAVTTGTASTTGTIDTTSTTDTTSTPGAAVQRGQEETKPEVSETQESCESTDLSESISLPKEPGVTTEVAPDTPSSLTMKIRIEKHYPSVGDNKKVAFVVTPSKTPPDKMEDDSTSDVQSCLFMTSLEGPVSAIFDLNHSLEQPNDSSLNQLFGLPRQDLALPSLFLGSAKTPQPQVTSAPPTAVGMRLAQLKGIDHHHHHHHTNTLPTSGVVVSEESHAPHMHKGGLVSSLTGLSHTAPSPPRPRTLPSQVSGSQLQQSTFASPLHSPGILQTAKRPVIDNGMDTTQMKQVLVGSAPLPSFTSGKLSRIEATTPKVPPTSEVT